MTCWEVGAGGGSIARLMSHIVGPSGLVIATDLDTSHMTRWDGVTELNNVTVMRHNVLNGPVKGGPFDLIHARLLLVHLPTPTEVLRELANALAPGGWLVIEEYEMTDPRSPLLAVPPGGDVALFDEVLAAIADELTRHGADLGWGRRVHQTMLAEGLLDVDSIVHRESWSGDPTGNMLYDINSRQLQPQMEAAGLPAKRLDEFRCMIRDPRFAALSYEFVSTRGRAPRKAEQS